MSGTVKNLSGFNLITKMKQVYLSPPLAKTIYAAIENLKASLVEEGYEIFIRHFKEHLFNLYGIHPILNEWFKEDVLNKLYLEWKQTNTGTFDDFIYKLVNFIEYIDDKPSLPLSEEDKTNKALSVYALIYLFNELHNNDIFVHDSVIYNQIINILKQFVLDELYNHAVIYINGSTSLDMLHHVSLDDTIKIDNNMDNKNNYKIFNLSVIEAIDKFFENYNDIKNKGSKSSLMCFFSAENIPYYNFINVNKTINLLTNNFFIDFTFRRVPGITHLFSLRVNSSLVITLYYNDEDQKFKLCTNNPFSNDNNSKLYNILDLPNINFNRYQIAFKISSNLSTIVVRHKVNDDTITELNILLEDSSFIKTSINELWLGLRVDRKDKYIENKITRCFILDNYWSNINLLFT